MKKDTPLWWRIFPWILSGGVLLVGLLAWLQFLGANLSRVGLYDLFPLMGISAWSLMWTHYIVDEVGRLTIKLPKSPLYTKLSAVVVLLLFLLHPALLSVALFSDNLGYPPLSYYQYAAQTAAWAINLGIISFFLFFIFEAYVFFKKRIDVSKLKWLVDLTQTVAMSFIFFHALTLGRHLVNGWFRSYWIVLGLLLIPCILHSHWEELKRNLPK